jgi:Uma2 family endonuclease
MRPFVQPAQQDPPKPLRFTISQYRQLGSTNLFNDVKTMLIDGELYVMGMPKPPHDFGLSAALEFLQSAFGGKPFYIRNQQGFDIGTDSDPGPDLAVVKGTFRDYRDKTPTEAVMVVEIAVTSLDIDTGRKADLYATAGVPDYWVLDLNGRQLHAFRDPQPGGTYAQRTLLNETDSIAPLAAPAASVKVADLLPSPAAP